MTNRPETADQIQATLPEPPQARFQRNRIVDQSKSEMYFLAGAGLIKIGISTNLKSRVRSIRNSSPVELELLAIRPQSCTFVESQTHFRFAHLRRHGEWFEDNGEIREFIESIIRQGKAHRPVRGRGSEPDLGALSFGGAA